MFADILNAGSFFLDVFKRMYPESDDIASAAKVAGQARNAYNVINTSSVHESAGRTLFSPMVIVDGTLLHQEYMPDLITVLNIRDVVATLSHFAIKNAEAVGVNISNYIGGANPNRAGLLSLISGLESMASGNIQAKKPEGKANGTVTPGASKTSLDLYKDLMEYVPLSIGRVVNATIFGKDGIQVDVPLTFRQIIVPASESSLDNIFNAAKIEDGGKMRWIMRSNGEITNPEWFNGTDIIRERFKTRVGDDTGYYEEAMRRDTRNKLEAVRTGTISVNTMANSIILSEDEASRLEIQIGKSFSNVNSRNDIFKKLSANTIIVCNDGRDIFTFYTRGQIIPAKYTRRELAVKTKKEQATNSLEGLVKLLNGGN